MSKRKKRTPVSTATAFGPTGDSSGPKNTSTSSRTGGQSDGWLTQAGIRETIESIAIALILAFVFRTFEAEAFVIPTGSMAPTLMGRHKDLTCPKCGYAFQASASSEVDPDTGRRTNSMVDQCRCPMCRYPIRVSPPNPQHENYASYNGDRILVAKFPYRFTEPRRWDVVVFKYPEQARTNYIKRLVGLPGETVKVFRGDIYIKKPGEDSFTIARKADRQLEAVLQPVYDDAYIGPLVAEGGWPQRWTSEPPEGWTPGDEGRAFRTDGTSASPAWLRYRHFVPTSSDWQEAEDGGSLADRPHRPQLISDYCAYNTSDYSRHGVLAYPNRAPPATLGLGYHWVGDLALDFTLEVLEDGGTAVVQLVEGGRVFECVLDVTTGEATLSIDGETGYRPTAKTAVRGPGKYRIMFSNIDDELRLWVDGRKVVFDSATTYPPLENTKPTEADLSPAGIASEGAAIQVSQLRIRRDIYYISARGNNGMMLLDYDPRPLNLEDERALAAFMQDPGLWRKVEYNSEEFPLQEDQFFMLGDNSAASKDSRLWGDEYFVDRDLLIGKAVFIYWPHSWHRIPGLNIPFPFFPNFARMEIVR